METGLLVLGGLVALWAVVIGRFVRPHEYLQKTAKLLVRGGDWTAIRVDEPGHVPAGFELHPKSVIKDHNPRRIVETRDRDFDERMLLEGDEAIALAAMSAEARRLIIGEAWALRVTVVGGVVSGTLADRAPERRVAAVTEQLRRVRDAVAFRVEDLGERLLANLGSERETEVAMRLFDLLVSGRFTREQEERAHHLAFDGDNDLRLRLRGASRAGERGTALLRSVAADPSAPDDLRAGAIQTLAARIHPSVGELIDWLPQSGPLVTRKIAALLGDTSIPAAEEALTSLVAHPAEDVRVEAVRALARIGNSWRALSCATSVVEDPSATATLRRAALAAVNAIRVRTKGVGAGQLSLIDEHSEVGQISLADDDRGSLSIQQPRRE